MFCLEELGVDSLWPRNVPKGLAPLNSSNRNDAFCDWDRKLFYALAMSQIRIRQRKAPLRELMVEGLDCKESDDLSMDQTGRTVGPDLRAGRQHWLP